MGWTGSIIQRVASGWKLGTVNLTNGAPGGMQRLDHTVDLCVCPQRYSERFWFISTVEYRDAAKASMRSIRVGYMLPVQWSHHRSIANRVQYDGVTTCLE